MLVYKISTALIVLYLAVLQNSSAEVQISTQRVFIEINNVQKVNVTVTDLNDSNAQLQFIVQHVDIVRIQPSVIPLEPTNQTYEVLMQATSAGHSEVNAFINASNIGVKDVYLVVDVCKSQIIDYISKIAGWIFIISWGSSFYPQIYSNYKRKSVIGLNFDYLALNLIGYLSFGVFISGLFFIPHLQQEYFVWHPRGLIPVKENDVVYNLHGTFAIILTIIQCFLYERGQQTVSITAKVVIALIATFYLVCCVLISINELRWLNFLYYCSYVKLVITILKYIPQAYMNYKRKSTNGWSIGLVLLDLNGGLLSIVQMVLDAYNYNDWSSIFGNPTKFGLGICNIVIHSFFITQHYILYKHEPLAPTKV